MAYKCIIKGENNFFFLLNKFQNKYVTNKECVLCIFRLNSMRIGGEVRGVCGGGVLNWKGANVIFFYIQFALQFCCEPNK